MLPPDADDLLAALGKRISDARKIREWRQADLAAASAVSRSTLTEIEKGSPSVSIGNYMLVLYALDIVGDASALVMSPQEQSLVSGMLPRRVRHG